MRPDTQIRCLWRDRRALGLGLLLGITMVTGARAQVPSPNMDDLITKAARQGSLRVIVELKIDTGSPPTHDAIARVQDQVLHQLAGTDHRVLRRFTTTPFMGLEMSADALRRLSGSSHVAGIREDMVLRPQAPPR